MDVPPLIAMRSAAKRADYLNLMEQRWGIRGMKGGLSGIGTGEAEDVDGTFNGGRETARVFDR